MIGKNIAAAGFLMATLIACNKSDKKDSNPPANPPAENPPSVILGLQGNLSTGGIGLILPTYLQGKFSDLGKPYAEAAVDIDLTKSGQKQPARVNAGVSVKACDSSVEATEFVKAAVIADNLPEQMKTDIEEISSWTVESGKLKGRLYFKERYKSEGDTGIVRVDALLANENAKECVLWNYTLTPASGVSAEYIHNSVEYLELVDSLEATWKGIGADFND